MNHTIVSRDIGFDHIGGVHFDFAHVHRHGEAGTLNCLDGSCFHIGSHDFARHHMVGQNLGQRGFVFQQGIQFGHAVVEYGQLVKGIPPFEAVYDKFARKDKTFIILNGGTTNHKTSLEDGLPLGSLNNHLLTLLDNGVSFAQFSEPDLGDQLTAVVFIVDERVFNKKKYPDFEDWVIENYGDLILGDGSAYQIARRIKESKSKEDQKVYLSWVKLVGGEKNVFLRDFLKNFRLA